MNGRLRRVSSHRRSTFSGGWELLRTVPGAAASAHELPEHGWLPVKSVGTVAHCERASGRWSFDDRSAESFDAHDWWYRLRFDAAGDVDASSQVLGFDGLATLCDAWLNGEPLLRSDNMFVALEVAVAGRLRQQANELILCFRSLDAALKAKRPRPAWRVPMLTQQQLRWHRSSLLGRTPGWSPPAAPVGPWRDVWLERRDVVRVQSHRLHAALEHGNGVIDLSLALETPAAIGSVSVMVEQGPDVHEAPLGSDGAGRWSGSVVVPGPALWWPHTHGEPVLYGVRARLVVDEAEVDLDLGSVGFRRIEVDTRDGGFSIQVNGVPIFCRGACWMPLDPVSLRATRQQVAEAVQQACHAGMNMIRVTGLTTYEEDSFYDECDRQGMLVWQDFMFANMDYPATDAEFLRQVESEVSQQMARWQARPCMAVLCGNSEVSQQAAMWGTSRERWEPALFSRTLADWVARDLPGTAYWASSAWGGSFPHQVDAGTTSYYGVGAYLRPPGDARLSGLRFATECLAIANVPVQETVEQLAGAGPLRVTHARWKERAPRDLTAGWDFEDVRDHYTRQLFGVDPTQMRYVDHDRYLHFARATSRELMSAAFSQWRTVDSACRGAMVLSMRDLWVGAGWGLVDALGRPKSCYWGLHRVLQPVAVLLTDEGNNGVVVHLVNEPGATLRARVRVEVWRGELLLAAGERDWIVEGRCAAKLPAIAFLDHFMDLTHAFRFGPLAHDCVVVTMHRDNGDFVGRAFHLPAGSGVDRLDDPGLDCVASSPDEQGRIVLTIMAAKLAMGVSVEAAGFLADDDCFHVAPGQETRLQLRPVDKRSSPLRGTVRALNARAAAVIRSAV